MPPTHTHPHTLAPGYPLESLLLSRSTPAPAMLLSVIEVNATRNWHDWQLPSNDNNNNNNYIVGEQRKIMEKKENLNMKTVEW